MPESHFYTNPFFWAFISMLGMACATSVFAKHKYRHNLIFITFTLTIVTVGRLVLVLPFCPQPRFASGGWHWIAGAVIILLSLLVAAIPFFTVRWWSPPQEGMRLRTSGIYGLIRHPIYLSELLWPIGLSIIFQSIYGLALTPLWWLVFLIHALSEEAELERTLGQEYVEYEKRVRGRLLPGLPF